jgi:hypothetical protein
MRRIVITNLIILFAVIFVIGQESKIKEPSKNKKTLLEKQETLEYKSSDFITFKSSSGRYVVYQNKDEGIIYLKDLNKQITNALENGLLPLIEPIWLENEKYAVIHITKYDFTKGKPGYRPYYYEYFVFNTQTSQSISLSKNPERIFKKYFRSLLSKGDLIESSYIAYIDSQYAIIGVFSCGQIELRCYYLVNIETGKVIDKNIYYYKSDWLDEYKKELLKQPKIHNDKDYYKKGKIKEDFFYTIAHNKIKRYWLSIQYSENGNIEKISRHGEGSNIISFYQNGKIKENIQIVYTNRINEIGEYHEFFSEDGKREYVDLYYCIEAGAPFQLKKRIILKKDEIEIQDK